LEQPVHKSKLAGFIIDCQSGDSHAATDFWANALGMAARALPPDEAEIYKQLVDSQHGLHIEVQTVSHPSRVHLDIETDDVEAEVRRLEQIGAKRVAAVKTWVVMEAPTGQRFCVVKVCSKDFAALATRWP
jgi:Glyoxalase-like domain